MVTTIVTRAAHSCVRRIPLAVLCVGIALLASGCNDSTTTKTPAPTPTSSAATSPATATIASVAPVEESLAVAREQYGAIAGDFNVCASDVNPGLEALPEGAYEDAVPYMRELLACEQTFQADLSRITFPASVSTEAGDVTATLQDLIASLQDFLANPDSITWEAMARANAAAKSAGHAMPTALEQSPPLPTP